MAAQEVNDWNRGTNGQVAGLLVLVFAVGCPALELAGFGFGIPLKLSIALSLVTLGGAVAGALLFRSHRIAGLVGGFVGGPSGFLLLYWYASGRQQLWNLEIFLVQSVGSLPGVGVAALIWWLTKDVPEPMSDDSL